MRRIDPYFREQADWQFVASILEASRGEKLKFERAWIIRASKGARTLADVQRNVRKAMETAKGLAGDVYLTLDAYLEEVVPQIAGVSWAKAVRLQPGVNVMDLTRLTLEMQHLVIKSSIDWVLEHEEQTVVVVPEAWKFIPEDRGTPVKRSAESFIRQGAGLKNFSLARQPGHRRHREENPSQRAAVDPWRAARGERTQAHAVEHSEERRATDRGRRRHPGARAVLRLLGKHVVRVYVQPAWMNPAQAEQVATGAMSIDIASRLSPGSPHWGKRKKEDEVTDAEARQLREDNAQLRRENADLHSRIAALEQHAAPVQNMLVWLKRIEFELRAMNGHRLTVLRRLQRPQRSRDR